MADSNGKTPLGYGHDKKGAAGGEDLGAGKPGVAHTAPVDAVSGKGSGPKVITFTLDGKEVSAREGETIWQVAKRLGTDIPHLCYSPEPTRQAEISYAVFCLKKKKIRPSTKTKKKKT